MTTLRPPRLRASPWGRLATCPLLEVKGLKKHFASRTGLFGPRTLVRAVDGVDFSVAAQESFAVVGESGCGKTTLARLVLALETPTEGRVMFDGNDLNGVPPKRLRALRREFQAVFQDPFSSLDPRMTVADIVCEPFAIHGLYRGPALRSRRLDFLLDAVGLARGHRDRYPHEFSGGQRQRIGIARALAMDPRLLVLDEPLSALDVSIQAQILNLLKDLQRDLRLAYLFISHDICVVRHLAGRVAVMYLGVIVELSEAEGLFRDPQHPYTEALLSAVPIPDPSARRGRKRALLSGETPSPAAPPAGCRFHPRCRYAVDSCKTQVPKLRETSTGASSACPVRPFASRPSEAAIGVRP
ncbi:MAG: ATP-binding cassette domain-containing protein [Elusimicrobia bacterium]|nr:ATP-binding cassette domain-containing protein [Elusimicrobiota bacterium]